MTDVMMSVEFEERFERMGVYELTGEAVRLMRHNFWLFSSFVTSFTIPCAIFTVFLVSAIDIHHHYVIEEFISKFVRRLWFLAICIMAVTAGSILCACVQGQLVILGWKFETRLSPLALNFIFIILNLLPVALLNNAVCTRGVLNIYRGEDLTTSVKNSFCDLHWAALRLIATQSLIYGYLFLVLYLCLFYTTPPTLTKVMSVSHWVSAALFLVFLYPLPAPQVAILEPKNYGPRGITRAMELALRRFSTALGLAFFSSSYYILLKLLVDVLLKDSYPFWTKLLVFPPLVTLVIAMTIFWQIVYTLFYFSASIHYDLDKGLIRSSEAERSGQTADINQPLLADAVDDNEDDSSSSVQRDREGSHSRATGQ